MPIMKNVSERKFVIAGKELDKGQEGQFAQSVIDRHVADYKGELVQVDSRKEETKPVVSQKEPETEIKTEESPVVAENAPTETETAAPVEEPKKYPSQMNKKELQDYLTEKGISFPEDASAKDLKELAK